MFKNHLKIAWRNMLKDKQFTLLNLLGLSTGLACVLLIYFWVNDELQTDRFNAKDSQLYEVLKKGKDGTGAIRIGDYTQGLLAQTLAADLPEVEYAVAVKKDRNASILSAGEKHLKITHQFASRDFFHVFTYPLITLTTGLIAGSYPALYLSRFKPVLILKGQTNTSPGEAWVRKGLVVFQFAISIILIVSVLVVQQQMKLIQTTNLGYNKDNIIRFSNDGNLAWQQEAFLTAIKKIPGVLHASGMEGDLLGRAGHSGGGISWEGKDPNLNLQYYGNGVDDDFIETMGIQVAAGRAFAASFADSSSVIFNQAAIAAMGIKNPLGKTVSLWGEKKQIMLIAIPFSWWAAHQWLQSFAYRINVSPAAFAITSVAVVVLTLVTISFQAIRAAIANPVKSLRTE